MSGVLWLQVRRGAPAHWMEWDDRRRGWLSVCNYRLFRPAPVYPNLGFGRPPADVRWCDRCRGRALWQAMRFEQSGLLTPPR